MGRKATAADVARQAGVSEATVDRVLNNRGGVSEDKERRVFAAARRLRLDRALDLRAARTLRVAAFLQPPSNPFHAALRAAFHAQNAGPNPFNIQTRIFHADPGAPDKTLVRLQQAADRHDALITCLPHDDALASLVERIAESGKPVVTIATDIGAPCAIYVGPDNYRAGRLAGELLGRFLGPAGGEVVQIAGLLSMIGQVERRAGFEDVLRERFPAVRIVGVFESREQGTRAGDLVVAALRENPKLRGIYNASAGAGAIADALGRLGKSADVTLVTHELTDHRRALLLSGAIDAVIDQEPVLEVDVALRAIAGALGRLEPPLTETETPLRVYMRENC